MTRGVNQGNVWNRPPWRPRFNDRKACSSIKTEQKCDRSRPRCWWQPYLQECFASYIHDSMTAGDRLGERHASVRRGSHAVFSTVFVLTGFLLTFAFLRQLKCQADAVQAKDAWKCCGCRKQMQNKYFSECDACWHKACDWSIREIMFNSYDYWLCPCCLGWEVLGAAAPLVSPEEPSNRHLCCFPGCGRGGRQACPDNFCFDFSCRIHVGRDGRCWCCRAPNFRD